MAREQNPKSRFCCGRNPEGDKEALWGRVIMSGGTFDYKQFHIGEIAREIERVIETEESEPPVKKEKSKYNWAIEEEIYRHNLSKETLDEFKKGVKLLKQAEVYAQRIDWLLEGDDGEETFHERLKEDLEKLENAN